LTETNDDSDDDVGEDQAQQRRPRKNAKLSSTSTVVPKENIPLVGNRRGELESAAGKAGVSPTSRGEEEMVAVELIGDNLSGLFVKKTLVFSPDVTVETMLRSGVNVLFGLHKSASADYEVTLEGKVLDPEVLVSRFVVVVC
jgi:hypothetical protein